MIGYGCCVGSWDKYLRNVAPRLTGQPVLALSGQPSISVAYNAILDHYRDAGLDAVILLHDDLRILDPDAEVKFLKALTDEDVALVGVCGGVSDQSLHWWNGEKVGHQYTDSGLLDFGPREGDVAFIEGSIMVLSPWAVKHLRFDERYPGFSAGYDDICLHAIAASKRVRVVDVATHHHSTVGWKSPQVEAAFAEAERLFQAKWWGR